MASAETPPDVRDGLAGHGLDVPRHARGDEREAAVDVWLLANHQSGRAPHLGSLRQWVRQPETVVGVVPGLSGGIVAAGLVLPGRAADGEGDLIPGLAHVTGVCVHPGVQGKGVGSSLLRCLLEAAGRNAFGRPCGPMLTTRPCCGSSPATDSPEAGGRRTTRTTSRWFIWSLISWLADGRTGRDLYWSQCSEPSLLTHGSRPNPGVAHSARVSRLGRGEGECRVHSKPRRRGHSNVARGRHGIAAPRCV